MNIIGLNLEKTSFGLTLDNGGACLMKNGNIISMISEERLNRKQYSSGYKQSLEYVLKTATIALKDIDILSVSSCLESHRSVKSVSKELKEKGIIIPKSKIKVCDHHLSHAYTAFYPSPFNKAIIMVLDGDGNAISSTLKNTKQYWKNNFDHQSYYIGEGNEIKLIEKDSNKAQENGFGGVYRYFTYFCGFPGYKFAGKLMGLSAYGYRRNKFKNVHLFQLLKNGKIKCTLPDSDRLNSSKIVEKWLKSKGINIKARKSGEKISKEIEDIAWLVQRELNRVLVHKVNYLVKKTGIKNLCIAGGVGLNAVTNREILDKTEIENIYIQPAAGDNGQCLGNAYWASHQFDKINCKRKKISIYQGKEYSNKDILTALKNRPELKYKKISFNNLAKIAAEKIAQNKIIGWFQGGSEIGPRALGNRSILANPISKEMKNILNAKVKHRESFRPFAPSVLEHKANQWFSIDIPAPHMIINAQVKKPHLIPSVTHHDNSSRIQTVNKKDNPRYFKLLSKFEKITKVPIIINTSFNDNEAIVESPENAVNTFLRTGIDFLFIGNYYVEKINISTTFEDLENSLKI